MRNLDWKNRIVLFLSCVMLTFGMIFGIGDTKAAFLNEKGHLLGYAEEGFLPVSNCLSEAGNTVLLKDWCLTTDTERVPDLFVRLYREGGIPEGTLTWSTEHSEYVTVEMRSDEVEAEDLSENTETEENELLSEQVYALSFTPNQEKLQVLGAAVCVKIDLIWTPKLKPEQTLKAEVQLILKPTEDAVLLPEVPVNPETGEDVAVPEEPEAGGETSEPETPENTENTDVTTEPDTGEEESTDTAVTEEPEEPKESEEPKVSEGMAEEETSEEAQTAERSTTEENTVTEEATITEPAEKDEATEPETPEETEPEITEPVVPEDTEPEEPPLDTSAFLDGANTGFAKNVPALIHMNIPETTDRVSLTMQGCLKEDKETVWENFPAFIKYSIDGGETYTVLADGGSIVWTPEQPGTQLISFDFAYASMNWEPTEENVPVDMDIVAHAYAADALLAESMLTLTVKDEEELRFEVISAKDNPDYPIITEKQLLRYTVIGNTTAEYWIERLSGNTYMKKTNDTDQSWPVLEKGAAAEDTEDMLLVVSSGDGTAQPGTYRLVVQENCQGVELQRTEITFFVNYRESTQEALK